MSDMKYCSYQSQHFLQSQVEHLRSTLRTW